MPSVYRDALVGHDNIQIQVPPEAVIAGKDYQLEVHKVEEFDGKKLVSLVYGDRYLFLKISSTLELKGIIRCFSFVLLSLAVVISANPQ